jgi:hypothetical protein
MSLFSCFTDKPKVIKEVDFKSITVEELNKHFTRDPSLVDKLNTYVGNFKGDPAVAGTILSKKGMKRLETGLLTERARILLKLTEFDDGLICSSLFTGLDAPGGLVKTLSQLPSAMILQWTAIQIESMMAELSQTPFVEPTLSLLGDAFVKLYATMDPKDADRMETNLANISSTGGLKFSKEGCWVSRKFYKHVLLLEETSRFILLKAVFTR